MGKVIQYDSDISYELGEGEARGLWSLAIKGEPRTIMTPFEGDKQFLAEVEAILKFERARLDHPEIYDPEFFNRKIYNDADVAAVLIAKGYLREGQTLKDLPPKEVKP